MATLPSGTSACAERVRIGRAVGRHALGAARGAPPRCPASTPRGGSSRGSPAPNVISATRPARRTARRAITSAAPSATSDFSRVRGAERHRRRDVEHEPGRQRPLGHVQAHVRLAHARGGGRVDLAHVVADLVGAQLRELGAGAEAGGAPVARQRARARGARRPGRARRAARAGSARALAGGRDLQTRLASRTAAAAARVALGGSRTGAEHALEQVVDASRPRSARRRRARCGGAARPAPGRGCRRPPRGRGRAAARARAPPARGRSARAGWRRTRCSCAMSSSP